MTETPFFFVTGPQRKSCSPELRNWRHLGSSRPTAAGSVPLAAARADAAEEDVELDKASAGSTELPGREDMVDDGVDDGVDAKAAPVAEVNGSRGGGVSVVMVAHETPGHTLGINNPVLHVTTSLSFSMTVLHDLYLSFHFSLTVARSASVLVPTSDANTPAKKGCDLMAV